MNYLDYIDTLDIFQVVIEGLEKLAYQLERIGLKQSAKAYLHQASELSEAYREFEENY